MACCSPLLLVLCAAALFFSPILFIFPAAVCPLVPVSLFLFSDAPVVQCSCFSVPVFSYTCFPFFPFSAFLFLCSCFQMVPFSSVPVFQCLISLFLFSVPCFSVPVVSVPVFECLVSLFLFSDVPVFQCRVSLPVFRCSCFPLFPFSSVPVFQCSCFPVFLLLCSCCLNAEARRIRLC